MNTEVSTNLDLQVEEAHPYFNDTTRYSCRLYAGDDLLAACQVLGRGNMDFSRGNVLAWVEVNPIHRGNNLAGVLLHLFQEKYGKLYSSGYRSRSGQGACKSWGVEIIPGRKERVTATEHYSFVDWETGEITS